MYSIISTKFHFNVVIVAVAILLNGQMSYCDNDAASINKNNTIKSNSSSNPAQSGIVVDTAKKTVEPAIVANKVNDNNAVPVEDAVAVAADVAIAAGAGANKFARGNLLNDTTEIPATIQTGFYIFVAFGLVVIFYISYRSYRKFRLRSSRAARRYGTRGNHSRHELQPLPSAIELESEEEENTVFDRINPKN